MDSGTSDTVPPEKTLVDSLASPATTSALSELVDRTHLASDTPASRQNENNTTSSLKQTVMDLQEDPNTEQDATGTLSGEVTLVVPDSELPPRSRWLPPVSVHHFFKVGVAEDMNRRCRRTMEVGFCGCVSECEIDLGER